MRAASREDEFRAYVAAARPRLVRTALLLGARDPHFAEDVVQVALTRLFVAWPRIKNGDRPDSYVHRILVNALIDENRRPFRRREATHAEVPDHPVIELPDDDFTHLRTALAELPAGMRAAIVFRHVYGLSVAETATALRCSQGNVKSQTARGLERLRAALSAEPAHPNHSGAFS
ncbi:MAG: SigE family RNA polymerase sigma factor [Acidothermaceae bacterium]